MLCHPKVMESRPDAKYSDFLLNERNFTIGLLDIPTKSFPTEDIHEECVLVKKLAFSCNYRDKGMMHLMYDSCVNKSNVSSYFFSPFGSEFCAEIVEVGKKVTGLKSGDRVIPDGTYPLKENQIKGGLPTNYASQRFEILHEKQIMKIPKEMDVVKAAAFTIAAQTVYSMLRKLEIKTGSNVLVLAATSNTSLTALNILKQSDINVYAMTTRSEAEEILIRNGADKVLPSILNDGQKCKAVLENEKVVFDYVVDPFFDLHLTRVLPFMNFNSKYVTCGFYRQHESFPETNSNGSGHYQPILQTLMFRNISVIGNCLGEKSDLENALKDYQERKFDIPIDSLFSGNQVMEFLDRSFNSRERLGKVVYRYE